MDATEFATTEEDCEGARRYAFVGGYLPPEHVSCVKRSWLDWFRFGGDDDERDARREQAREEREQRREERRRGD